MFARKLAGGEIKPSDINTLIKGDVLLEMDRAGLAIVSDKTRNLVVIGEKATTVIDRLQELRSKLHVRHGIARFIDGGELFFNALLETDPDAAAFDRLRKVFLAPIIRSFGEVGNLAEGDIVRAIELPGSLFTSDVVANIDFNFARALIDDRIAVDFDNIARRFPRKRRIGGRKESLADRLKGLPNN